MQDNDTLKYTTLGLVVAGLAMSFFGGGIIARGLLVLGIAGLGYLLKVEGLNRSSSGTRNAALAAQCAFVLVSFALPFELVVRPAFEEARLARLRATQAQSDLKGYRSGLSELESTEQVQVSEAGLQRENRRVLALDLDIASLHEQLEFRTGREEVEPEPGTDMLVLLQSKIDQAKSRLNDKKRARASRGEIIEFSSELRLGLDAVPDPAAAKIALPELDVVEVAIDRAIDAGIRVIEKIEVGELGPAGHDTPPQIDVAVRTVTLEVRGTLEAITRYLHLLAKGEPFLGVRSVAVPARRIKQGRTQKKDEAEQIQGDYVSARIEVQAFFKNTGGLEPAEGETQGAGEAPTTGSRRWFR